MSYLPLSEAERGLLDHVLMWGSDSYPIQKLSKGNWIWHEARGVQGAPTVYKTKKAAFAAFEAWIDQALERSGLEAQEKAQEEMA